MRHQNLHGECDKCDELFDLYPGFHAGLRLWFNTVRRSFFDAHISCAGRGKIDQEAAFWKHTSRAHWGQSSHNYNAAIDLFQMTPQGLYSLDPHWFQDVMATLPGDCTWYGAPHAKFYEMPHVEVTEWRDLAAGEILKLVET